MKGPKLPINIPAKPSSSKYSSSPKAKPKPKRGKIPIQYQDLMAHKIQRSFRSKMASKKKTLKLSLNRVLPEGVAGKAYNYLYPK
jgi:hypothetical protein